MCADVQCYVAGSHRKLHRHVHPLTAQCSFDTDQPDGAACDDGDPMTEDDVCRRGVCIGVMCADVQCDVATSDCKLAGQCD
eukprot:COSAG06_NODE_58502_length_286_cov_0.410112_1_plen_80_part_10